MSCQRLYRDDRVYGDIVGRGAVTDENRGVLNAEGINKETTTHVIMDTIALGIDGMKPSLCDRWIETGELSNISKLREEGTYGRAKCSSLVSARQWATHFTGMDADQHGITGFVRSEAVEHERDKQPFKRISPDHQTLINLRDFRVETYPELLTDCGSKVGLINPLPIWPPLNLADGFCIAGLVTPPTADEYAYPASLEEELSEFGYQIDVQYGNRPYGFIDDLLFQEENVNFEDLRTEMFDVLDGRIRYTKHAIETKDIDFIFTLLKSVDIIQHAFWAHMDEGTGPFADCILDCYRRVDELIGWIRTTYPDTNLIAFSDHGFGPRQDPKSGWLHSVGYLLDTYVTIPYQVKSLYHRFLKSETDFDLSELNRLSGDHRNPAMWLMAGPDVASVGQQDIAFEDITPTLLALTRTAIPTAYVGEPVSTALTVEVSYQDRNIEPNNRMRPDISAEVSDRLYNLGYAEMVEPDD